MIIWFSDYLIIIWLFDCLIVWLFIYLINWLIDYFIFFYYIDFWIFWLFDYHFIIWLFDYLINWLFDYLIILLFDYMIILLLDCFFDYFGCSILKVKVAGRELHHLRHRGRPRLRRRWPGGSCIIFAIEAVLVG